MLILLDSMQLHLDELVVKMSVQKFPKLQKKS